jgi:glyoxylase I family protein
VTETSSKRESTTGSQQNTAGVRLTHYDHVNLTVPDLDVAAEWYVQVLGFEEVLRVPDAGGRGQKLLLHHPHTGLMLNFTLHANVIDGVFTEFRTGLDHISFAVDGPPGQLEEIAARLKTFGVTHGAIATLPRGRVMPLRDPFGIQLELFEAKL